MSGSIGIKNYTNKNTRSSLFDLNNNILRLSAAYDFSSFRLENTLSFNLYKSDTALSKEVYFTALKGKGISVNPVLKVRVLPYQPECAISIERQNLNLFMLDQTGQRFSALEENSVRKSNGYGKLTFSKKVNTTLFFENLKCSGGKGFFELYPFTSWVIFSEVPDRYRITNTSFNFSNYGMKFSYDAPSLKLLYIKMDCAASYSNLKIDYTTEELKKFLGLVPVYQNEKNHTFEKKYILLYVVLHSSMDIRNLKTTVCVSQMIPIELKSHHKSGVGAGSSETRTRTYGGFKGELGFEWVKDKKR
jgi:hypothetical protein